MRQIFECYCVPAVDAVNAALSGFTPTEIIVLTIVSLISYLSVIDTLKEWWKIGPKVIVFRLIVMLCFRKKA